MKRSAEVQGGKDGWDTMDQTVDAPQRASAAQLAKRKILKGRSHLKSGQTTPTESHGPGLSFGKPAGSPFGNVDPNIVNGSQGLQNGFAQNGFAQSGFGQNGFQFGASQNGFGQKPFSPELGQQPGTSFGSDHSNDAASNPAPSIFGNSTGFNFAVPDSTPIVNPFAFTNGNSDSSENKPKGLNFQGSIFSFGGNQGKEQEGNREMANGKRSADGEQNTPRRRGYLNGGAFGNNDNSSNGDEAPQWTSNSPFNFTPTQPVDKPLFGSTSAFNFSSNQPADKPATPSLFNFAPSQPSDKPPSTNMFDFTPSQPVDKPSTRPVFDTSASQTAGKPSTGPLFNFSPALPADKPITTPLFNFASNQSGDKSSSGSLFNLVPSQPSEKPSFNFPSTFNFSPSQPTEKSLFNETSTFNFSENSSRGQTPEKEASAKATPEPEQRPPSLFVQSVTRNLFSNPPPQVSSTNEELFVPLATASELIEPAVPHLDTSKPNKVIASTSLDAKEQRKSPSIGKEPSTNHAEPSNDSGFDGSQPAGQEKQAESPEAGIEGALSASKQLVSTSMINNHNTKASDDPKPALNISGSALSQQRPIPTSNLFSFSSNVQLTKPASTSAAQTVDPKSNAQPTWNVLGEPEKKESETKKTNLFAQSVGDYSMPLFSSQWQQKSPNGVTKNTRDLQKTQPVQKRGDTKKQGMQRNEDEFNENEGVSSSGKRDTTLSDQETAAPFSADSKLQKISSVNGDRTPSPEHDSTPQADIESVKMIWTEIPDSIPPDLTNDQKKGYITAWRLDSLDNSFREFINNTPCLWANEDKIEQYRDYVKAIKTAPDASIPLTHTASSTIAPKLAGPKRKAEDASRADAMKKRKSKDDVGYPQLPLPTPSAQESETSKMFASLAKGGADGSNLSNIFGQRSTPAAKSLENGPGQPVHSFFPTTVSASSVLPPASKAPTVATNSVSVLSVPQFGGASSGSNFLGQFAKQADETAKKEAAKRKAEECSSDDDDSSEDEKPVKKQKVNNTTNPLPTSNAAAEPSPKLGENPSRPGFDWTPKPTGKSLLDRVEFPPATPKDKFLDHPFIKSTLQAGSTSSDVAPVKSSPFANLDFNAGAKQEKSSSGSSSFVPGSAGKATSFNLASLSYTPFSFTKQAAPLVSDNICSPASVLDSGIISVATSDNVFGKHATDDASGGDSGLVMSSTSIWALQPSSPPRPVSQSVYQPAYTFPHQPLDDTDNDKYSPEVTYSDDDKELHDIKNSSSDEEHNDVNEEDDDKEEEEYGGLGYGREEDMEEEEL